MKLMLLASATLAAIISANPTTAQDANVGFQQDDRCTVAGSVFIAELDACVLRVTDPIEIEKATFEDGTGVSADTPEDPECDGKPDGFKFDRKVIGPDGREGIAHMVCGTRPE